MRFWLPVPVLSRIHGWNQFGALACSGHKHFYVLYFYRVHYWGSMKWPTVPPQRRPSWKVNGWMNQQYSIIFNKYVLAIWNKIGGFHSFSHSLQQLAGPPMDPPLQQGAACRSANTQIRGEHVGDQHGEVELSTAILGAPTVQSLVVPFLVVRSSEDQEVGKLVCVVFNLDSRSEIRIPRGYFACCFGASQHHGVSTSRKITCIWMN